MGDSGERGTEAFVRLLSEGHEDERVKRDALTAMQGRELWLATWEPRAKGFRTLINSGGDEALPVFSSERELHNAASRFGWLEPDGSIATHRGQGAEVLRHAWTREYAYLVVDIAADHSVEFNREELRASVEHDEITGEYKSSPPPARPSKRPSAQSNEIREVSVAPPQLGSAGTYGAASIIPSKRKAAPQPVEVEEPQKAAPLDDPLVNIEADLPSAPPASPKDAQPSTTDERESFPPDFGDPALAGAAAPSAAPSPDEPSIEGQASEPPSAEAQAEAPAESEAPPEQPESEAPPEQQESEAPPEPEPEQRRPAPSLGAIAKVGTELAEVEKAPSDDALSDFAAALRTYPEVEWAAFCNIAEVSGAVTPTIGLRVDASYRANVNEIVERLFEIGQDHKWDLDVLLFDDMELMRKARSMALVFFPWMPKRV